MQGRTVGSVAVVCLFLTMPAWAETQTPTKSVVDTDAIVGNIQSELQLTAVQVQKITPIINEENKKLSKILTPDQMNQWLNLLNQFHQKPNKSKKHSASKSSRSKI